MADEMELVVLALGGIAIAAIAWSLLNSFGIFSQFAGVGGVRNKERWEIHRDEEGRLIGVDVFRNVSS